MNISRLSRTPLYDLHCELGGKMVPFAGYEMPVQYTSGIIKEHLHTRNAASLFDVSHMGQVTIIGDNAISSLEKLVPVDLENLSQNHSTYALFTNDKGGILDDLIITRRSENELMLVVNAACKHQDFVYLQKHIDKSCTLKMPEDRALLALQGPSAAAMLTELLPETKNLIFMRGCNVSLNGIDIYVTRSGYTGEDGFELSIANKDAEYIARQLLNFDEVKLAGLGARDSLRLEAGMCLYGHDLNTDTTPIDASLQWSIAKSRRNDGVKKGGFPGAEIILQQIQNGSAEYKRVGFDVKGRVPVREGAIVLNDEGVEVGKITSGGFSPSLKKPIAMGYLKSTQISNNSILKTVIRNKQIELSVATMPFVKHRYVRS